MSRRLRRMSPESSCSTSTPSNSSGSVEFEGVDVLQLDSGDMRRKRRDMQIVFQDPYASLNPRMTVGTIVSEPLIIHGGMSTSERAERVAGLLKKVGLDPNYRK